MRQGKRSLKERLTITGCSNVLGTHKLPLQVIVKSRNPRVFKGKSLPPRIFYTSSKNAWQTKSLFKEFFEEVFFPCVRDYSLTNNIEPKALLILDNASSHCEADDLISDDGKIRVLFLPPNVTSLIQPMDQNCLLSLKTRYRKELLKKLLLKENINLVEDLKKWSI